ncbi:MAG: hypothetical protein GXN92_03695 [Candidatus Micrarchaeota archaeon]|nr:hypothetical protein [Candidatus Micrarchaeota archaeon]
MEWYNFVKERVEREREIDYYYGPALERIPFTVENRVDMDTLIRNKAMRPGWIVNLTENRLKNLAEIVRSGINGLAYHDWKMLDVNYWDFKRRWKEALEVAQELEREPRDAILLAVKWKSGDSIKHAYEALKPYINKKNVLWHWLSAWGTQIPVSCALQKIKVVGGAIDYILFDDEFYGVLPQDLEQNVRFLAKEFPDLDERERARLAASKEVAKLVNGYYNDVWKTLDEIATQYGLDRKRLKLAFVEALKAQPSYLRAFDYSVHALKTLREKAEKLHKEGVLDKVAYSGGFFYLPARIVAGLIRDIKHDPLIKDKKEAIIEHITTGIGPYLAGHPRIIGDRLEREFSAHREEVQRKRKLKEITF